MRFAVRVEVRRRAGIADPEGRTIEAALPAIGIENVSGVRMGRSIRFVVTASDTEAARAIADAACRRLLANPVLEEYTLDEVAAVGPDEDDRLGEASSLDPVAPEVS